MSGERWREWALCPDLRIYLFAGVGRAGRATADVRTVCIPGAAKRKARTCILGEL
jgi:hypothetical protein